MPTNPSPVLSPDMIDEIAAAVAEVATTVGFGAVAIIIEKGEPRRVQLTKDRFFRSRAPHQPPGVWPLNSG